MTGCHHSGHLVFRTDVVHLDWSCFMSSDWVNGKSVGLLLHLVSTGIKPPTVVTLGSPMNSNLCNSSMCANSFFNLSPQSIVAIISRTDSGSDSREWLNLQPFLVIIYPQCGLSLEVFIPLPGLGSSVRSCDGTACLRCCQDTNTDKLKIRAHTTNAETEGEQAARQAGRQTCGRTEGKAHHHGML